MGDAVMFSEDDSFLRGAELALEDLRLEYPDYTFQAQVFDDENNYEKGMLLIDKFINDKQVAGVIGSQSFSILSSSAQRLERAGKILIMPHGSEDSVMAKGYANVFSNTFSPYSMGQAIQAYLETAGLTKIAVYYDHTDYSHNLLRGMNDADTGAVKIIDYASGSMEQAEFDRTFEKWELLGAQCVVVIHDTDPAFNIAQKIRAVCPDFPIVGDFAFDIPGMIAQMDGRAEGIVIPYVFPVEGSPELDDFITRYEARFNSEYTPWAAHGYDSVRMIADTAMEQNTSDPVLIAKAIHENGYKGVLGQISFNPDGSLASGAIPCQIVKDGRFQLYR